MNAQLKLAIKLASLEDSRDKAIKIFNKLCSSDTSPENKSKYICEYMKAFPEEGLGALNNIRDSIRFLSEDEREKVLETLARISSDPEVDSVQRLLSTLTLYNLGNIHKCHPCFASIARDNLVVSDHRVEACRFLFATEDEEWMDVASETLRDITSSKFSKLSTEQRYRIICCFNSTTGIRSVFNQRKLMVPYDEEFMYGLQKPFFFDSENDTRYRILSGQHLLQMAILPEDERKNVIQELIAIATDVEEEYNIRADAADVIIRLGGKHAQEGRRIMSELSGKHKDVYDDAQNVHNASISECVDKFIVQLIENTALGNVTYEAVKDRVSVLISNSSKGAQGKQSGPGYLDSRERLSAFESLNRIDLDTATFTSYNVTIRDILVLVWVKIQECNEENLRGEMEKRLLEELVDMAGTCSSGHSSRIVNVLSYYDDTFTISWQDQIIANVKGRLEARIRDCDEDLSEAVMLGMMDGASEDDREIYIEFVTENLLEIEDEMKTEFVGDGYLEEKEFDRLFEIARKAWV